MPASEITREQEHVAGLYDRVDALREQTAARLARALREDGGTAQSRLERDAAVAGCTGQLARLEAAESGLCFGRLDLRSGECLRNGRIGLRDASGEGEPLLLDWRAPAARAFYVATARAPQGVRRRRHITMRGRRVTGLDDEVLDRDELAGAAGLTGEAALLAAVQAAGRADRQDARGHGRHRSTPHRDRPRAAATAGRPRDRDAAVADGHYPRRARCRACQDGGGSRGRRGRRTARRVAATTSTWR